MIGWAAFALAFADALVLGSLAVAAAIVYRKAAPLLPMLGMMGGMLGAGGAPDVATPDRCEYEDHEWFPLDSPTMHGYTGPAHYCGRCGYTERVPGT